METKDIEVMTATGKQTVKAIVLESLFAIHQSVMVDPDDEPTFTITHVLTGYAMVQGLTKPRYAYVIADRVLKTLSPEQKQKFSFTDPNKAPKQLGKRIAKYMQAAKRCENNTEIEQMVGVFYRDREDTERLRIKINPEANKLMDDKALGSEKLTFDLIMGDIKL